jgi:FlaA1/EpsC-like NDP-sugar epimerase
MMRTARENAGAFCAVRFGNVIGSRGSVITTFTKQIERGGPLTVTDPRMSRFFMSVQEAVQLVLQAGAMVSGGEVYMLEMGEPVNILELAKRMIRLSGLEVGSDIEVRITGRRPGEKLLERLTAEGEKTEATSHPSIRLVHALPLEDAKLDVGLEALAGIAASTDSTAGADTLLQLAQSINPHRPVADPEGAPWSSTTI